MRFKKKMAKCLHINKYALDLLKFTLDLEIQYKKNIFKI